MNTILFYLLSFCSVLNISALLEAERMINRYDKMHFMGKPITRETFVQRHRSHQDQLHEVVVSIVKKNMDSLEEMILQRSSPGSISYQQWFSYDEITDIVKNPAATANVKQWLTENNIDITWTSNRGDYIKATAPISQWEKILNCEFYAYEDLSVTKHRTDGKPFLVHRSTEYFIPIHLKEDIHAIFNTVQTPIEFHQRFRMINEPISATNEPLPYKTHLRVHPEALSKQLATQGTNYVTVAFLNSLYRIASNAGDARQRQSIFSTQNEYFATSDLTQFQNTYNTPVQSATAPNGFNSTYCSGTMSCSEGNLDVQYIMGMAQHTATIYWYEPSSGSGDPMTNWLVDIADEKHPPQSNSMSWGANEYKVDSRYIQSFNAEAMILAGLGVTVVVSSGDDGAPSKDTSTGSCLCSTNYGYNADFPAGSPWVTAVGATMGPETSSPEIACQSQSGGVITTGGGFSTVYARPSWQSKVITNYFKLATGTNKPTSGYGTGRGYPDISLIGVKYAVIIGGKPMSIYGTSASAPVFAAFVSLVNAYRLQNNLTSIGFLNPTLYSVGWNNTQGLNNKYNASYNDITSGHNKCCALRDSSKSAVCCSSGFTATTGWDPVTGWGSVNFPEFAAIFNIAAPYTAPGDDTPSALAPFPYVVVAAVVVVVIGSILIACCTAIVRFVCFPKATSATTTTGTASGAGQGVPRSASTSSHSLPLSPSGSIRRQPSQALSVSAAASGSIRAPPLSPTLSPTTGRPPLPPSASGRQQPQSAQGSLPMSMASHSMDYPYLVPTASVEAIEYELIEPAYIIDQHQSSYDHHGVVAVPSTTAQRF